jgi:hypothetical protein
MLFTLLLLSVINTALIFFAFVRAGRTILGLNDVVTASVDIANYQNKKIKELGDTIESAMDALLIADYKAAAATGQDAD